MYQPGDLVVFGIHGVCRIQNRQRMQVDGKDAWFLVLEPLTQEGAKILIPEDNPVALEKMTRLMSEAEMEAMLNLPTLREGAWEPNENLRKQLHKELISGKDREGLLRELCTLCRQKRILAAAGKRLRQSDEGFLADARKRICGEISAVKKVSQEEALNYLKEKLQ